MTDEQMIKEIIERRRQWGETRFSDFDWLINHIEMQQKLNEELKELAKDLGKEQAQCLKRIEELRVKTNQLEQENRDSQTIINVYEEALQQILNIGHKTYKTESEVIAEKALKFYEE